ncbi:MAG TPA: Zn-dependent protease [Deltaproteobacteria bacterium]|nr:Zn-dependent protease [Deltaproteobacteria bacterium]
MWIALGAALFSLVVEPAAASRLTLALYRARPITPAQAPRLYEAVEELSRRAALPAAPLLYYAPTPVVNAFAVGTRRNPAIALTDGLLRTLTLRETAAVLSHETAHIANGDLRVMSLADYVSRLTGLFALTGQLLLILALPAVALGAVKVNLWGLLALAVSPHLAVLAQLGLSRVREYDADLLAVRLTGDPEGLASALAKIERVNRSWRTWLLPGWGNPYPSWLRTHPPTEERIRRLLETQQQQQTPWQHDPIGFTAFSPVRPRPRWHLHGLWR